MKSRLALRRVARTVTATATTLRDRRGHRPPEQSTPLDDLADAAPWNLAVRVARLRARRRRRSGQPTVVIVSWNTSAATSDVLDAVRRHSPADTRLLVVDNGSSDATPRMLAARDDIATLRLPTNVGHGTALDLALCRLRSPVAVILDSDAFPIGDDWLDSVLDPLSEPGVIAAGTRSSRDFVHPMFMAVDVAAVIERKLSFRPYRLPGTESLPPRWGIDAFDTGEWLSRCLADHEKRFVERTPNPISGLPGMTAGGVVYHHGGVSRGVGTDRSWEQAYAALSARDV